MKKLLLIFALLLPLGAAWADDLILSAPKVRASNHMPAEGEDVIWTWTGNYSGDFRYRLDDEYYYIYTTETSLTSTDLEPGRHTLHVQESYLVPDSSDQYWSEDGSAEVIIFTLDTSGTDYVQNLPTAVAHTELLPTVIRILIYLGGLLAFVSFMYSGIWLIIFGDRSEDVSSIKRNFVFSIVGMAMIGMAYSIVAGILNLI